MKVTTDACLFGALQPSFDKRGNGKKILDIGAGTGLLSLMMAQKNPLAKITGIEIEAKTAEEARKNIAESTFEEVNIQSIDILDFKTNELFNHIISNPPFHESQLASDNSLKNIAHHSSSLTLKNLFEIINNLLEPDGTASVLIPYYREAEAKYLALANLLYTQKVYHVRQTPGHSIFRSIIFFSKNITPQENDEIVIKDANNRYTPEFISLLKPFYLYL
jgi:tRNA1Val (adenine37-N6)-methyltransferase